jgi:hypothetical protein
MSPTATKVGPGLGEGDGAPLGADVGLALAVGLRLGLGEGDGDAGLPPQPAMPTAKTNPTNARPVELRTVSTPGLAVTLFLPLPPNHSQDDASNERA